VQWATARGLERRIENVEFLLGDPAEMTFHSPFDAVVGRFVLMYYPDPVHAIRNLSRHLRPGGIMVFQEFDMSYVRSYPAAPTFERACTLMTGTFRATGTRVQMGADLYSVFLTAGLPGPSLRMDVLIAGGETFPGYEVLTETIESLLPVMERFGIATAAEVNLPSLAKRMREEITARKGVAFSPALIGAWSRKF
jgi:SAM-dependent methyltransferase